MRVLKWVVTLLVLLVVGSFLHYVLPKHAVVYVTGAENRIVSPDEYRGFRSFGQQSTTTAGTGLAGADVFFINTIKRSGGPLVFRNEDTGFGFPWYLKFNSADVQAEAQNAISTAETPKWMVVRYYGWRINYLSMFPNAISMRPATNPDERIIPWFNIILLIALIAIVWAIWARLRRWSQRRRDPMTAAWTAPSQRRGWFGR
jgi:hypothetical protein